ncbi:hypothetical protein BX600DRAFT_506947 [Xylariales sp. PMI_506]|nr:hypothetical protein BX600DRAFT_506947 [Xylariales sp. PMI_506]
MALRSLKGKHAIITGGSRGIGLAIAQRFASEGARVTLAGRVEKTLQQAALSLSTGLSPGAAAGSVKHHGYHVMDVREEAAWEGLAQQCKGSGIDILVNAAGISQNSFLVRTRAQAADDIIDINLKGTIWGCRAISTLMMAQKSGCIINVSSLLATHAGRGASVYAASKAGIVALTRSLAWELGRFGVRANVLLPGYIQTEMTESMDTDGNLSTHIPLGRLGLAEEVADAAAFLALNPYAHNTVLNLDGGLSAT